jgi:hypothetical protein
MTTPSTMANLSTNSIENSPQGSESLSVIDDNMRAYGSILKRSVSSKNATFASGVITIGAEAGAYLVNATSTINSIVGGYAGGLFELIFTNTTPQPIIASSTISLWEVVSGYRGVSVIVEKASNGVFSIRSYTNVLESRVGTAEYNINNLGDVLGDTQTALTNLTNTISGLNTAVSARNQLILGYIDGNGTYGDSYVSNMANQWLHTAINVPVGTWEITGYSAITPSTDVHASFSIGLVRADNTTTGVTTPPVFMNISGKGGIYYPHQFKAIITNNTGTTQNYRLKTGAVQYTQNSTAVGLYGSAVGETQLYGIRLY